MGWGVRDHILEETARAVLQKVGADQPINLRAPYAFGSVVEVTFASDEVVRALAKKIQNLERPSVTERGWCGWDRLIPRRRGHKPEFDTRLRPSSAAQSTLPIGRAKSSSSATAPERSTSAESIGADSAGFGSSGR
ncbi:unnamed protein product [Prorocentrum cordatum]|uniref:Uncharacterized protein n=1 Tax=Prorocentrum cordatum TaxID=2364126 RepID=A0ABN9RNJ6_9DINO|nr:unnamed protein product [Polarella glacialis]